MDVYYYVVEQHEEEHLFKSILDKTRIIGDEGQGPYHFDQELSNMAGNQQGQTPKINGVRLD